MRRLLLILGLPFVLISCGKSDGEEMLYKYQEDNVKSGLNMELSDLDFKIIKVKEVGNITAHDSAVIYRKKLVKLWFGEDATKQESDTLTYDFVIRRLDSMRSQAQSIILSNIALDKEYENYEWKETRDNATSAYLDASSWKIMDDSYRKKPDSILSVKYEANYSMNNPMLNNNKQTFDKYYYSNTEKTMFIKEEDHSSSK